MDLWQRLGWMRSSRRFVYGAALIAALTLLEPRSAMAHHFMGDEVPRTWFEGLMSGLAHPVIGPDHLAFIVAVGLLGALYPKGFLIPWVTVAAAMMGSTIHLAQVAIAGVELWVAVSIGVLGYVLTLSPRLTMSAVVGLAAIAGIFHGYAYGESIFGAEPTPLMAYLLGFTLIQLAIALMAQYIGTKLLSTLPVLPNVAQFRSSGWVLCGIGLAFFASHAINLLLLASKP